MIRKILPNGEFSKNVLTIMSGTIIAQALPLAILPILTRMYSPEEFGIFGIYMAIFMTFSVITTLRYEAAIVLPRKDSDAANLVILSILIAFIISLIIALPIVMFNVEIALLLGNRELENLLYFVPGSIFLMGIFQSLNYWNIRKKYFFGLATCKVAQSGSMSLIQLGGGYFRIGMIGLPIGHVCGLIVAVFSIMRISYKNDRNVFKECTKVKILANKNKYIDYPKHTALPSLLDTFTLQAPVFFITRAFELSIVGFFSFTFRILAAPAGIISNAIGQVYLQKIANIANSNPTHLKSEVMSTAQKLTLISVVVFSPFLIFGEEIFAITFGEEWRVGGYYAKYLSIPLAIRFIVSPLSSILGVTNNLKLGAIWKYVYFFTTVTVLFFAMEYSFEVFLTAYVAIEIVMYLLYFGIIYYASNNYQKRSIV